MREKAIAKKFVGSSPFTKTMGETELEKEKEYQENLTRVKSVFRKLKEAFKTIETSDDAKIQSVRTKNTDRIKELKDELENLEDLKELRTEIAIVGATGEGKSSLINALLDHRNVLPTSGMRACTAVIVEVSENSETDKFEADIEFRSEEDWLKERECLLKDLTNFEGKLRNQAPDSSSDAYPSYLKMIAVYGKIDEELEAPTEITKWLGQRMTVSESDPEEFRHKVENYIIQREENEDELQYWPIVERVRLRIPRCDVCSSGAVLVDLPGVRDFNAAREKVTKEYLKTCKSVWVVASIHRAIDDKTAKNLLGENFRRQMLMDGNYGNIAFICSKTDVIESSECYRVAKWLGLQSEVEKVTCEILDMEHKKKVLQTEMGSYEKETSGIQQKVKQLQNELEKVQKEKSQNTDYIDVQISEESKDLAVVDGKIETCKSKINEIEKNLVAKRKERDAICARARNEYSAQEIKKDFRAGLKEMRRQACIKEEEEEEDESDEENEKDENLVKSLNVFCCSATEYQKIQNPLLEDGPPRVFTYVEETQVPQLRNYVHQVTLKNKCQAMDVLIYQLSRLVSDLQNTMTNSTLKNDLTDTYVKKSHTQLKAVTQTLSDSLDSFFSEINNKLTEGAVVAEYQAADTCSTWGNKAQSPRKGVESSSQPRPGYPFKTYMATVNRRGVFKSPLYGDINFNWDLSAPIERQQTVIWDRVFNNDIYATIEKMRKDANNCMTKLTDEMDSALADAGFPEAEEDEIMYKITTRLFEKSNNLKNIILEQQRDLSRKITPCVESYLKLTYTTCSAEKGKGMFQRIKEKMNFDVETLKAIMFQAAVMEVTKGLERLRSKVVGEVEQMCEALVEDLKTGLKSRTVRPSLYGALLSDLKTCAKSLLPNIISSSQGSEEGIQDDSQNSDTQQSGLSERVPTEAGQNTSPLKRNISVEEHWKDVKRQKIGKECYNPQDLDRVLIQSKMDCEEQLRIERRLRNHCTENGLEFLGKTPGNGDCFFVAIASQLDRIGAHQMNPMELRLKVSEFIRMNPNLEGPDGVISLENYIEGNLEDYCERMAKRGTWADHVVIIAMAQMLGYDIVIVMSSPSTQPEDCLTWVIGDNSLQRKPLLLGHLFENHYQSLQPILV